MPVWHRTIHLGGPVKRYKEGELTIPELAAEVAGKIERSGWRDEISDRTWLDGALEDLKKVTDRDEYREVFDTIYDLADHDRVWIETW